MGVPRSLRLLMGLMALWPCQATGQLPVPARAGATLFTLDPAGTAVGGFPTDIRLLKGLVEVAIKDGAPMLKASSVSELLITLPRVLPQNFTVEIELVPKACCNPHDLSLEGTAAINQGPGSAHVLWDSDGYLAIIGGARDNWERPMPEDLQAALPGTLTRVVLVVEGNTLTLHTNGRQLYTMPGRHFARGRVLRVHLGGQDDQAQAVYLARLRITEGTGSPAILAADAGLPWIPAGGEASASGTSQQQGALGGGAVAVTGVRAQVDSQGVATVVWDQVADATGYFVVRWLVGDLACCSNMTPPEGVPALTWQNGTLPRAGTYGYRVYASTPSTILKGETELTFRGIRAPMSRTISLGSVTASGGRSAPVSRTIALAQVVATGPMITVTAPRAITGLPGTNTAPTFPVSRTITLPALTAAGGIAGPSSRTVTLPPVRAIGPDRAP